MQRSRMLIALAFGPVLFGQSYTFTSLEFPGGAAALTTGTFPSGINNLGTIVGWYFDTTRTFQHGFLLQEGTYTAFDVPDSIETSLNGINGQGDIIGDYALSAPGHTFILQGIVLTNIDFPGFGSRSLGINNLDEIVGFYSDNGFLHGYLRERDQFITIDVPFAVAGSTTATGRNDSGQIVGSYGGSDGNVHGFLKDGSSFTGLDVPFPGVMNTACNGINNKGEIVGGYLDNLGVHGFIFSNGVFTSLDVSFPEVSDVTSTIVEGINDLGEIVGTYARTGGTTFGFLAKPVGGASQ